MTELGEIHEGRHRVRVLANEVIPEKSEGKKLSYEPVTQRINRFYEHRFMKEAKAALVRTQLKFIAGTIAAVVSGVYAYFYYYGGKVRHQLQSLSLDINSSFFTSSFENLTEPFDFCKRPVNKPCRKRLPILVKVLLAMKNYYKWPKKCRKILFTGF